MSEKLRSSASPSSTRLGRLAAIALVCAPMLLGTACVQSPTGPGILYMNVKGTLGPAGGTDTPRTGQACARTALALIAWGDASLETAKRNGNVTQITTVDHLGDDERGALRKLTDIVDGNDVRMV